MQKKFFKDRIIAYKKDKKYLAVSLEFDLLAEGANIREALDRLYDATIGYLKMCYDEGENDSEIYRKAPKHYQNIYDLFVELTEKKKKKGEEKKQEMALREKETQAAQFTYSSKSICHA